jgi:uncharacterized lipoprotein YddW (UPF0748 family)
MYKRIILLSIVAFALFHTAQAQIKPLPPIAEMRGVWIASIANIDWPSSPLLSPAQQRAEYDSILSVLKSMGMNAVFVQVRPAGDALYKSTLAPWSKYLTGKQGQAPSPEYDPLEYMIKAAHERRMEFHAWLNPYRATTDLDTASLAPTHPLRALSPDRKAQWFFKYAGKYYFNPANPLVIKHLENVVRDIVIRYDVDGIHFDDYFYPYPEPGQSIDDYDQFVANPHGFNNIYDWRRDNVNRLIESVSKTIRGVKPWVRFGVSPFGVWRNSSRDPNGSATNAGMTCYDDLYADVLNWLQKGWIDYVAPQIYWSIGYPPADYRTLVDWWSKHTYGRQLYIGHAIYKIGNSALYKDPNWNQYDQINRQVELNRITAGINGSLYFSTKPLLKNSLGVQDSLTRSLYRTTALIPPVTTIKNTLPVVTEFCKVQGNQDSVKLSWHACEVLSGEEMPYYFGIFRFNGDEIGNFDDPKNLRAVTQYGAEEEEWKFADQDIREGEYFTYVLVAYNRYHVGGGASEPLSIKKTKSGIKRKRPFFGYLFK